MYGLAESAGAGAATALGGRLPPPHRRAQPWAGTGAAACGPSPNDRAPFPRARGASVSAAACHRETPTPSFLAAASGGVGHNAGCSPGNNRAPGMAARLPRLATLVRAVHLTATASPDSPPKLIYLVRHGQTHM